MTIKIWTNKRRTARGFTLIQLLIVVGLITTLAALLLGVVGRGRSAAHRSSCDVNLKGISVALDTYRQESGRYPQALSDLRDKNYLAATDLRCPADGDKTSDGYADFYVVREPRDSEELPMVLCPFHEGDGQYGAQAYKGRFTTQNSTQPATLVSATDATVVHPGKTPVAASAGMKLQGGDRVITGQAGLAQIRFADTSTGTLNANCDVTILQSFVSGQARGGLYTVVRQNVPQSIGGDARSNAVNYNVFHGSNFDVATPTATAGALGTEFTIKVTGLTEADTQMTVIDSTVALTTTEMTEEISNAKETNPVGVTVKPGKGDRLRVKIRKPRKSRKLRNLPSLTTASNAVPTAAPLIPLPLPTATLPPVTIPPVAIPTATLPPVTIPGVTIPGVTIPGVTTPPVTTPPVTIPGL